MIKSLNHFDEFIAKFPASAAWSEFRQWGRDWSSKVGIPSKQNEDWRYTSFKFLSDKDYRPALLSQRTDVKPKLSEDFFHLVFVDGKLDLSISNLNELLLYFEIKYGQELVQGDSGQIGSSEFYIENQIIGPVTITALDALNSAFSQQVVFLKQKDNTALPKPLMISHFSSQNESSIFPNLLLVVGKNSKLNLIEQFVSNKDVLTNSVAQVKLNENASLSYSQLINEHPMAVNYRKINFYLKNESNLQSLVVASGGQIIRQNLNVYMLKPGASAKLKAINLCGQKNHIDHHTLIDHVVGGCTTSQIYKSILDGESRSVFDGKVLIRKESQKASSEQLNQNLLLSAKAEADTKPNLEIFADDVKATHGATVGQLNEEELFYLLSRGISEEKALEMLSLGFVVDLLEDVEDLCVKNYLYENINRLYVGMKL